ncbi:GSCFA domain-containing protein [Reichenbachiella agarivorans]|uniref:GSCFA domain-containing protein n=1 Tax=Reichenbachiella agarivorans TaxID=2979464 RepID=A0ABY6CRK6_9BACT|nr:GSCFA domain-containing protein [Reichenbachiella agarivorans]UXP32474.1 GSCFA domain-containing protein [Reichenbachiella agarivorans]
MTHFRTELFIDENPDKIKADSKILSFGSGFTESLMSPMNKYNFNIVNNPYGTIYNPISIFNLITDTINNKEINTDLLTENDGQWNHYDFHPEHSAGSKDELVERLQQKVTETHEYLKKTDYVIITLGSAFVYKLNSTKKIVANCHRGSREQFSKELLTPQAIVDGFREIYNSLNHVKNIILVVSPVQHTKDTLTLNAVSKSVLRLACHMIMSEFAYVKYFPAYEFLLGDLRDYRFYEKDLIHPNELATDYIFKKFAEGYFHPDIKDAILNIEELLSGMHHAPYNPQSTEYKKSLKEAIDNISTMTDKMDLSELINDLKSKIG